MPAVQVLATGTVLVFFSALQSRLWPWRTTAANLPDASLRRDAEQALALAYRVRELVRL